MGVASALGGLSFSIFINSYSSGGLSLPLIIILQITDFKSKKKIRNIKNSDKFIKIYIKKSKFSQLY